MKLFGTDGIRGKAGSAPLVPETVARVGAALVRSTAVAEDGGARARGTGMKDTPVDAAVVGIIDSVDLSE